MFNCDKRPFQRFDSFLFCCERKLVFLAPVLAILFIFEFLTTVVLCCVPLQLPRNPYPNSKVRTVKFVAIFKWTFCDLG